MLMADFCKGITFERFPHPDNCFQFVVCVNEIPSIVDCDPNEVFYNGGCVEGKYIFSNSYVYNQKYHFNVSKVIL